ncbi:alpha/beta hydrolase family protein [Jongsikchunia kroppenstedtii]|uniref:alpha/beta hydrolase family protein n=1 Tax=Jongsikchunia kroppenstedtii TaxID=1121721 RepID=UPI0005B86D66|nr:alpha/beta family hydrolase [Jongsikchunia kroppenstedtii]
MAAASKPGVTSWQQTLDGVDIVGALHRPDRDPIAAVVIAHGAGSNFQSKLLRALAVDLCERGLLVGRIDLPYRQRREKGPPSPSKSADDRAGIVAAAAAMRALAGDVPVLVGGQSYGGRQASMVVAEDPAVADGLLLTAYPLHPPGKPDRLRTEHFPDVTRPTVIIHGSSDPFATSAELESAVAAIPAAVHIVEITGVGHELNPDKKPVARLTGDAVEQYLL